MAIKQLSDGGPDGTLLGQDYADKIGFFGLTTPIAQPALTVVATTTASTTLNQTRITRVENVLINLGLMNTGG